MTQGVCHNRLSHVYIGDVKRDVECDIAGDIAPYLLTLANGNSLI
jgi:hypothetical protein